MEWLQSVSLGKYSSKEDEFIGEIEKAAFKTDIMSSVEKNYFIHNDYFCVCLHGFKYHHFDKLVPSFDT